MAKPVSGDWQKLVKLGRYLKGSPRCVLCYEWQYEESALSGCRHSERVGCKATGQTTSGGLIQLGMHHIKSWSRTQDSVTLSSAGGELVALSKLAMEMLGVRPMSIEWEAASEDTACQLYADASAALSIAKRQGAGNMRNVNIEANGFKRSHFKKGCSIRNSIV